MRKLRIVGDGLITRVFDVASGEEIENITAIHISQKGGEPAHVWLEVTDTSVELVGAIEVTAQEAPAPFTV